MIPANDPKNGQCGDKIDILFVNERPGPTSLKTGFISFDNPDDSARRFRRLFVEVFGLKYGGKIFITNAVLWCPKVENYRNQNPTRLEVRCGVEILLDQIKQIKPKIIVAMGRSALNALYFCFNDNDDLSRARSINLKDMAGTIITKTPYKIIPLFHTSQLNLRNRSEKQQLKDWEKMATYI